VLRRRQTTFARVEAQLPMSVPKAVQDLSVFPSPWTMRPLLCRICLYSCRGRSLLCLACHPAVIPGASNSFVMFRRNLGPKLMPLSGDAPVNSAFQQCG
jgi:hypothetical protein